MSASPSRAIGAATRAAQHPTTRRTGRGPRAGQSRGRSRHRVRGRVHVTRAWPSPARRPAPASPPPMPRDSLPRHTHRGRRGHKTLRAAIEPQRTAVRMRKSSMPRS
eukprot:7356602-Prymnesium_polylepis.1